MDEYQRLTAIYEESPKFDANVLWRQWSAGVLTSFDESDALEPPLTASDASEPRGKAVLERLDSVDALESYRTHRTARARGDYPLSVQEPCCGS